MKWILGAGVVVLCLGSIATYATPVRVFKIDGRIPSTQQGVWLTCKDVMKYPRSNTAGANGISEPVPNVDYSDICFPTYDMSTTDEVSTAVTVAKKEFFEKVANEFPQKVKELMTDKEFLEKIREVVMSMKSEIKAEVRKELEAERANDRRGR